VFNWFKSRKRATIEFGVDVHSHLLPGIDDGVRSFEQAEEIIKTFLDLGYRKIITTPHVMSDTYRNTTEIILSKLAELQVYLKSRNIEVELSAAAEYYLDEDLLAKLDKGESLLTFGQKYLLFETNFLTEPMNLRDFVFLAATRGYRPVLAHPERYLYLQNDYQLMQELLDRGVLFQCNISSFTGYYSKAVQTTVNKMVDRGMIHFLGSDCHHMQHINLVSTALGMKYFQKALTLPLLNDTL
jgi:protein-tyrosine phosphatase